MKRTIAAAIALGLLCSGLVASLVVLVYLFRVGVWAGVCYIVFLVLLAIAVCNRNPRGYPS